MTVSTTKNAEYAVGNGITTSFPFDFVTLDASHIYVYVNGSEVTTGFTVSVNPDQANNPGGSVDFDVAVSSGDEVAIIRVVPLNQLVDYTTYDRFPAEVHESALDKLTMLVQQAQNSVDGTFGFSQVVSDAGETKIFLSAADRAGKILSFDSNGDLTATQEIGSWRGDWASSVIYYGRDIWRDSSGDLYYVHTQHTSVSEADSIAKSTLFLDASVVANTVAFDSVADMQAAAFLRVGDRVRTLGYYAPGDGGGNDYKIVAAGTGTADGGSFIDLSGSGLQAKGLFVDGVVNVKQFGAVGDGVADDTVAIQTAIDTSVSVLFPVGTYRVTSSLTPKYSGQTFVGTRGPNGSVLVADSDIPIFNITLQYRETCRYRDLSFRAKTPGTGTGFKSEPTVYFPTFVMEGCSFERSLKLCIDANLIISYITNCDFGTYGTAGATHQHILCQGQDLTRPNNLTSNLNVIKHCRFRGATGVQYASIFTDALGVWLHNNDFELNYMTDAVVRFRGVLGITLRENWFERNESTYLCSFGMDSTGVTQGCLDTLIEDNWISLHTNNTHVLYADTTNVSFSFNYNSGTGFSNKFVLRVNSSDDPAEYMNVFLGNRLTGYVAMYKENSFYTPYATNWIAPNIIARSSYPQVTFQNDSSQQQGVIIGSGTNVTGTLYHRAPASHRFQSTAAADWAFIDSAGLGIASGGWDTPHLRLGSYHLWVDSTGDLRIKNGAPTSDTDGTIVGTQT
jgi:hypothetical protein